MSKYTTELRFICEQKAGYVESVGATYIDAVINASWDKIFTTTAAFFDETYKPIICKKILKHYYTREIGAETVGLWIFWMNTKLEEILPYYNKLWASALLEFDPFNDVNYTRSGNRSGNSTENSTENRTENQTENETRNRTENVDVDNSDTRNTSGNSTVNTTHNNTHSTSDVTRDLYSDTPQGALNGVENENYLTNARKTTDALSESSQDTDTQAGTTAGTDAGHFVGNTDTAATETGTRAGTTAGTTAGQKAGETEEEWLERITGKMNTTSYSELLEKYRQTFLNIDLMVIEEFKDLFFNLW